MALEIVALILATISLAIAYWRSSGRSTSAVFGPSS